MHSGVCIPEEWVMARSVLAPQMGHILKRNFVQDLGSCTKFPMPPLLLGIAQSCLSQSNDGTMWGPPVMLVGL